jgi:acyl-CoA synthetase (AMP-forming)/AMP-acid ligase II
MHTPYGATECLPVATIEAAEVLSETAVQTDEGAGVCVGRKFDSIDWRVIRITDEPIATIEEAEELPPGEIGELIVRGPQASLQYATCREFNGQTKIQKSRAWASSLLCGTSLHGGEDAPARSETELAEPSWHRMGDVGYLDDEGRFWYCGRKSQRVESAGGPLFTECVESVFNTHPKVRRSALVGVGPRGRQTAVTVAEIEPSSQPETVREELIEIAQAHEHTCTIQHVLFHPRLPVDARHNAKIHREALAEWASDRVPEPA